MKCSTRKKWKELSERERERKKRKRMSEWGTERTEDRQKGKEWHVGFDVVTAWCWHQRLLASWQMLPVFFRSSTSCSIFDFLLCSFSLFLPFFACIFFGRFHILLVSTQSSSACVCVCVCVHVCFFIKGLLSIWISDASISSFSQWNFVRVVRLARD